MSARRAPAALLLVLVLTGCAEAGAGAGATPTAVVTPPAPAAPAAPSAPPAAAPPAAGLLDSEPATLDALRAAQGRRPVSVQVAGVDAPVEAYTTDPVTGGLDLPDDAGTVAWWGSGASPGTGSGSVVLAAHVSYEGRTGPFTRLSAVPAGTEVVVTSADGSTSRYAVRGTRSAPKEALDRAELFRLDGPPALVLVTCGGAYDPATRSYEDNVVVTATPV